MHAIVIGRPGGPEVLERRQVETPEPGPGQIRVKVQAAGVNRADLLQRRGHYPAPPGWPEEIPGLEYAGMVDRVGSAVHDWQPGDRVMGLVGGGGYAEYVVVHEREAIAMPAALSFVEAAAVPEVFITAHDALFTRLGLRPGETLLIHAVGSGVGTAALQIAKATGAFVYGTSRTDWKLDRAVNLGLDVPIDTSSDDFAERVQQHTAGGVDAILELVGAPYLSANLRCLASMGRIVIVGLTGGRETELDLGTVLRKRAQIIGTALRSRPLEEKVVATRAFAREVAPLIADGRVTPVVDEVFPLEEAAEAHRHMEANANFGKIILEVTHE